MLSLVFLQMKAVQCSVQGTVFLPLLGHVEWNEKLEAAETAATHFVLDGFDVPKLSFCQVAKACNTNRL